jgi:hypothetical protein
MKTQSQLTQKRQTNLNFALTTAVLIVGLFQVSIAGEIGVQAFTGHSSDGQEGVIVKLKRCSSKQIAFPPATTGPDGKCTFSGLGPGKYRLEFTKIGYTVIVSPSEVTLKANDAPIERVAAFKKDETIDPYRVAWLLRDRANGDAARYTNDLTTLRTSRIFDANALRIVAAGNARTLPRPIDGTINYSPETGPINVVASGKSGPATYDITAKTKFVDIFGRKIDRTVVTASAPARFTLGNDGERNVVSLVVIDPRAPAMYGQADMMAYEKTPTTSASR